MNEIYMLIQDLIEKISHVSVNTQNMIKTATALTLSLISLWVARRILASIEKRLSNSENMIFNPQTIKLIQKFVVYSIILVTGSYLINLFNIGLLSRLFYAFFLLLIAVPMKEFIKLILIFMEKNIADKTETGVDNIIFDLFNKFVGVLVYGTAIILALDILGINIMPFIAGAGVAGVAIGFAAKDTLSNLIAGILLIIDRPFEIGDRIEVWSAPSGTATWGDVIDIGLRATRIKTTDNIIIIIPNNEIMTRDIVNYTILSERIRVRIEIGISYDSDINLAKSEIIKVAEKISWVLKNPAPQVVVRNFGASSVDLQLRVWIDDARKRMDTISKVTDNVKDAFDRAGIEIPYPKRDITIIHKGGNSGNLTAE